MCVLVADKTTEVHLGSFILCRGARLFENPADREQNLSLEASCRCFQEHIIINLKNILKHRFTFWPYGNIPELKKFRRSSSGCIRQ